MDYKLEVIILPVADVDASKAFYEERMGFVCDSDHRAGDQFRAVQLTPPGSRCSITIGVGLTTLAPGSIKGLHLVVEDIVAAREELLERGAPAGEPFHFGPTGKVDGLDPERRPYGTFLELPDPDGNVWLVQEVSEPAR